MRNLRYGVRLFLAWCGERDPRTLTAEDLLAYLAHVHRLLPNPFSRFSRVKPVKVFYAWMHRHGMIPSNPAASVKLPRLPEDVGHTPTVADVTALLRACRGRKSFEGMRNAALVILAFDTGARANEIRVLRTGDLNVAERVVRLTGKARPGQPPAVRFAPLSPGTLKKVKAYLAARRDIPGDVLFCDRHGLMLSRRGFSEVMERLRARAGITATWHGIRRAFLTESLRSGCPEEVLRRIAGHRDTRMLRRYVALRTDDLVRFHDRSSPTRFLID